MRKCFNFVLKKWKRKNKCNDGLMIGLLIHLLGLCWGGICVFMKRKMSV